jgi:aminopeptidase-like protein
MNSESIGQSMYALACRLFPICRSITGNGVRLTLEILRETIPRLEMREVPSGTEVFDWTVPKEWNIFDAYIEDMQGNRVISFSDSNLHVMGYSLPMDKVLGRGELMEMVYTQPDQPDAIPYVTSYYEERSGFCMSENQKMHLTRDEYRAVIKSELKSGSMTYGEMLLRGKTDEEIFLSTYVCHPSMANNELSGPCVATYLAKWLSEKARRYSYRIVFIPETIGSIAYLSKNLDVMKKRVIAGFNISCVGDGGPFSYVPSRSGNSLADKVAMNVLHFYASDHKKYTYLDRGSDERQYCAPGVDLPLCCICRSKYGEYPEYHTSKDDLSFISPEGLAGSFGIYKKCIEALEGNYTYKVTNLCEPQLGRKGLYPTLSQKGGYAGVRAMRDFLAYADGTNDLIGIGNIIGVPVDALVPIADCAERCGLVRRM